MNRKKNGTLIAASLDTVRTYLRYTSRSNLSVKIVGNYDKETNKSSYYRVTIME